MNMVDVRMEMVVDMLGVECKLQTLIKRSDDAFKIKIQSLSSTQIT